MKYIEAEYTDGYVHREDEQDHSPYVSGRNIFYDIVNQLPEPIHGPMVRFSLIDVDQRWDLDWTTLPENAIPIRVKYFSRDSIDGVWIEDARVVGIDFGYEYIEIVDGEEHNVVEVVNL